MRYAIISDIHGNLEALERVLADIDERDVDEILCLGDVIGYGPNPNECVDLVRAQAESTLAGNHDYAPLGKLDISYFNPWARRAIEWTADELTQESIDFLLSLPLKENRDGFTIVHATPRHPEEWNYIITVGDAKENFPEFQGQVCFVGHSHVPLIIGMDDRSRCATESSNPLKLAQEKRYIINVGSVGQPRDFDPRAAYGVFDTEEMAYELVRLEYDIPKTQKKMRDAGLPEFLIERIARGQ